MSDYEKVLSGLDQAREGADSMKSRLEPDPQETRIDSNAEAVERLREVADYFEGKPEPEPEPPKPPEPPEPPRPDDEPTFTDAEIKAIRVIVREELDKRKPPKPPPPPPPPPGDRRAKIIDDYFGSLDVPWPVRERLSRQSLSLEGLSLGRASREPEALMALARSGEVQYSLALAAATDYEPMGARIIAAAAAKRLALHKFLAVVEKESAARSVFHADWGTIGAKRLPFAWLPVTRPRLDALKAHITKGGQSNGVGTTAITYGPFVMELDKMRNGGGVNPTNQLLYGAGLIKEYMDKYSSDIRAYASYNAGEPNWQRGLDYARDVQAKADAWERRLADTDPEPPPEPPERPWIEIGPKPEWSKGAGPYVAAHPTNYDLRPDVKKLAEKYINLPRFYRKVSANTYRNHPPGVRPPRDRVSVDFWDWGGRGRPLDDALQEALTDVIFDDPEPPLIAWLISNGKMWVRDGRGWRPSPPGSAGSDAPHREHIHCTFE